MRLLLCFSALALAAAPARAQVRLAGGLGATWSSTLVTDQIINPVDVKAAIAPTLTASASLPFGDRIRVGLQGSLTSSSLKATETGNPDSDMGTLRTGEILAFAAGPAMVRHVYWKAGIGMLKYWPSEKQGLFLQGGPARLLGSVGAEYRHSWRSGLDLTISARYSYHRFTTDQLEARGFSRTQDVHRIMIGVGVAR